MMLMITDDLETMHDSSSTDDLDITPADNEYEKPNLGWYVFFPWLELGGVRT